MEKIINNKYTKDDIYTMFKDELKGHYLKREGSIGNNIHEFNNNIEQKEEEKEKTSISEKIKYKFMIKIVAVLFIGIGILGYKYIENPKIKNNSIVSWIKNEYKKNYSKNEIIENFEEISKYIYAKVENIVPQSLYTKVVNNYINNIKPNMLDFNLNKILRNKEIENTVAVFNEDNIQINSNDIAKVEEITTTSSQVSLMEMDKDEILSKNINIILPVNGTVTSIYGAREEIFENVGYHTGIDIANSLNTEIKSATDGVVVLAQNMDKYYGNNIEIEKDGVIFKYAHLNEIKVSVGEEVTQGQIIGLMGSTGMSTGSHLHFEIKINDRSVDPELIIKIR